MLVGDLGASFLLLANSSSLQSDALLGFCSDVLVRRRAAALPRFYRDQLPVLRSALLYGGSVSSE